MKLGKIWQWVAIALGAIVLYQVFQSKNAPAPGTVNPFNVG